MIRILAVILLLAAIPAHAGFKMFGPNGYMNSSETDEEKAEREAREEHYRQIVEETRAATAKHAATRKVSPPRYTKEELLQGRPCPAPVNIKGPRPGGHRRHVWREATGFNTPAERTRYVREIQRLNRELKKERAKPNPAGDHPSKIRKELTPKF